MQSAPIARIFPLPNGQVFVLDELGILRTYRGPQLEFRGVINVRARGEGLSSLPPGVPRVFRVSPQGTRALATLGDKTVRVWNLTGEPGQVLLNLPQPLVDASFRADGKHVLLAAGPRAVTFQIETRVARRLVVREGPIRRIAAGPGSEFALAMADGVVDHWRAPNDGDPAGTRLFTVPNLDRFAMGHEGTVFASDRAGRIWLRRLGGPKFEIPSRGRVLGETFLDNYLLAMTSDAALLVDLATGKVALKRDLPVSVMTGIPASKRYVFATLEDAQVLRVLDLQQNGTLPAPVGHRAPILRAIEGGGGALISVARDRSAFGWTRGGEPTWDRRGTVSLRDIALVGSPGKRRVALVAASRSVKLTSLTPGEPASQAKFEAEARCAAAAPGGRALFGLGDGSVHQVDVDGGRLVKSWQLFSGPVRRIVSVVGGYVACGDQEVVFVREAKTVRRPAASVVPSSLCAREGLVFVGTSGGDVWVWAADGRPLGANRGVHVGGVSALYAGPGGKLVSGGEGYDLAVWRYTRAEGFERLETRQLELSWDRVTFLGPAGDANEFLLGTARGALIRCEWR